MKKIVMYTDRHSMKIEFFLFSKGKLIRQASLTVQEIEAMNASSPPRNILPMFELFSEELETTDTISLWQQNAWSGDGGETLLGVWEDWRMLESDEALAKVMQKPMENEVMHELCFADVGATVDNYHVLERRLSHEGHRTNVYVHIVFEDLNTGKTYMFIFGKDMSDEGDHDYPHKAYQAHKGKPVAYYEPMNRGMSLEVEE